MVFQRLKLCQNHSWSNFCYSMSFCTWKYLGRHPSKRPHKMHAHSVRNGWLYMSTRKCDLIRNALWPICNEVTVIYNAHYKNNIAHSSRASLEVSALSHDNVCVKLRAETQEETVNQGSERSNPQHSSPSQSQKYRSKRSEYNTDRT